MDAVPMEKDAQGLWSLIRKNLEGRLSSGSFQEWVSPCIALRCEGNTLSIQVPNASTKLWIEQQLAEEFNDALVQGDLAHLNLVFQISGSLQVQTAQPNATPMVVENPQISFPSLFARYTLDRFVVGPSSQLAFAAANSVVEHFGKSSSSFNMNPLFIYGSSGLGKTHLMVGVGQAIRDKNPSAKLHYLKVDGFFHEVTAAISKRNTEPLRKKYQGCDVLLLDDVQALGKMERTQEEIFYVLEYLLQHGKQIVITSDKPPQQLEGLHERLKTRFKWGLTADIQPPDFETRVAILKKKLEEPDFLEAPRIDDEVLGFIAHRGKSSVRDLEGLLNRVIFQAQFMGVSPTLEVAQSAFQGQNGDELLGAVPMERILRSVAESFHISYGDLKKKRGREASILVPRQVAMYLARELSVASYSDIAKEFDMHHSTVMNAIDSVKQRMKKDNDFHKLIHALLNTVY
jgi:chromosomal replication initiator protein